MIHLDNGGRLVQAPGELPDLRGARKLYLDVETTSCAGRFNGLSAWHGADICGVAATADDATGAWYVPVRHRDGNNVPLEVYRQWLRDVVSSCETWVNHNVKFDAHFCARDGAEFTGRLECTLTVAKMIDSDRGHGRGGYGLDALSRDWLHRDISKLEARLQPYFMIGRKKVIDHGAVPVDIEAEYSCQDVMTTRDLHALELQHVPAEMERIVEIERLLTPVLYDVEKEGMRVDQQHLLKTEYLLTRELLQIEEQINSLIGVTVNPSSRDDCYELLCCRYGLPVLAHTDTKDSATGQYNPSFDKYALAAYADHPQVACDEKLREVVHLLLRYRQRSVLLNTFVIPYRTLNVDGVMHPTYNQIVRTGRESCSDPNMQQLSPEAKGLVIPGLDEAFLRYDYSQIEFRLIVHFIENRAAIEAYLRDPYTDFHQWVADMCGIPRKPAKNVNFMMAYGGGKKKAVSMLSQSMDLVRRIYDELEQVSPEQRQAFAMRACAARGLEVYEKYHGTLPELKRESWQAGAVVKRRGYARTAYGRRRHMEARRAYTAFNTCVQGTAADVLKDRAVALAPRYNSRVRDLGLRLCAKVHDELVLVGPRDVTLDDDVRRELARVLEQPQVSFKVPIVASCGWSDATWAAASSDEGEVDVRPLPAVEGIRENTEEPV